MLDSTMIEKILAWKKRWGVIHQVEIPSEPNTKTCFYRSLTPLESKYLRELMESGQQEADWDTAVVALGLLHPSVRDIKLPGTINILSTHILAVSNPPDETVGSLISEAREWAKNATETNFAINICLSICNVYPSINLINLLNLSIENLLRIAALLEITLKTQLFNIDTNKSDIKVAPLKPGVAKSMKDQMGNIENTSSSLRAAIEKARGNKGNK